MEGTATNARGDPIPGIPKPTDQDTAAVTLAASLGDFVWIDANNNGIQDSEEAGLNGVVVELLGGNGNPTGKITVTANNPSTDQPGWYLFTSLAPGSYRVQFVNPENSRYTFTVRDVANAQGDAADSDANSSGQTGIITLAPGENNLTVDAGMVVPTSLDKTTEPSQPQAARRIFLPVIVR